ncbi:MULTISPECIES: DUF2202 domain-containing protein [Methanothrix]|jgi:hypothetical protein|uniref:DUF2202 domain-containing protein n=1 Tax=Methanothrix TaxID=2222 RepID=UPI001B651D0D|nr:DUF2202 domain-containing protein [Methanothrix sp.]MBP7067022.1 DUF2202 domain-containing protein [Methanothrix sp.]HPE50838.1 DUF2202 domain-containing protein [Methanothrix soehngenii]HRW31346.1 DUF2202 domain-containing protein [Methanothrix sp.]
MRAINAVLLLALLLTFSGCVERPEAPTVSEQQATEEWKADGIVNEGEYTRSMLLQAPTRQGYSGGDMQISWRNDEEDLYLALNGSTLGWLALGFEPLEWMKDSDIILASVDKGTAVVLDEYCTGNYGPHIEDTMLGGTDDIQEFSGSESAGRTTIELKRSLQSSDRFDKSFSPGQAVSIIWALSDNPDISQKHDVAYGEGILSLTRAGGVASASLPGSLTPIEKDGLIFIWEEEKAARDIYSSLYEKNNLTIFLDLTRSEESHMDQAKAVIDKYGLVLPADVPGVFENQTLQDIHDRLLAEGLESDEQALKVAAEFEEISIMDLEAELAAAENEDVRTMYQGLLAGSRKHLRSYVADLKEQGIEYEPRHLLRSEFEETVRV